jgi:hypothetical protein
MDFRDEQLDKNIDGLIVMNDKIKNSIIAQHNNNNQLYNNGIFKRFMAVYEATQEILACANYSSFASVRGIACHWRFKCHSTIYIYFILKLCKK